MERHTIYRYAALACAGALTLSACSPSSTMHNSADTATSNVALEDATVESVMALNQSNHADPSDVDYSRDGATTISLSGATANIDGQGAIAEGDTVTISAKGTYIISGDYSGSVHIEAGEKDKVRLVLDGVSMASDKASIEATGGNELVIIMAEGSENSLVDTQAEAHAQADETASVPSGTVESHIDTTIGGNGTLDITGGRHGISCSDGLTIYSGSVRVTSFDDGIRGKDYVWIEGGDLQISARGDAIQANNSEQAERGFVYIAGGTIDVSESEKAIDAVTDIVIAGGDLTTVSSDDGWEAAYLLLADGTGQVTSGDDPLNASADAGNPWIAVTGGEWILNGQGDGFDSNGAARISGGSVTVFGPETGGNGAIDTEDGLEMAGGTLFAIGSQGMDEGPRLDSVQATVKFTDNFPADTTLSIVDSDGKELASYENRTHGQSVFFSSPDIVAGKQYVVTVDGTEVARGVAGEYDENRMDGPGGGGNPGGGPGGMPGDAPGDRPGGQGGPVPPDSEPEEGDRPDGVPPDAPNDSTRPDFPGRGIPPEKR